MVRIGTWNLENLAPPGPDSASPESQAAYDAKLDTLAATITDLDPDVLAVQEVLHPTALDDLVTRLPGTWRTALAEPDGRGIRVGFLSRAALTRLEQVTDFPAGLGPVQADDTGRVLTGLGGTVALSDRKRTTPQIVRPGDGRRTHCANTTPSSVGQEGRVSARCDSQPEDLLSP